MSVVPVKNATRMMAPASLLDNRIELSFADGARGLIPYADVPEVKVRAGISGLERPDPCEMALQTAEGEGVEVSWAFARHYGGASYRPTAGKPSIDTDAEGRCQQTTGSSRRPWKPASARWPGRAQDILTSDCSVRSSCRSVVLEIPLQMLMEFFSHVFPSRPLALLDEAVLLRRV